jgi:hypothetical protein
MQRILIPISVSNPRFTTAVLERVLSTFSQGFGDITFLIADKLYLYNKVRDVDGGFELAAALNDYRARNSESEDRFRWLEKLEQRHLRPLGIKSQILTIDDLSDVHLVTILRNVVLAYHTIPEFQRDVQEAAENFYAGHGELTPTRKQLRLSASYVLEEIGLNIRVRVLGGIEYEYYGGEYVKPLLNVYAGKYGISVEELAHSKPKVLRYVFLSQPSDLSFGGGSTV